MMLMLMSNWPHAQTQQSLQLGATVAEQREQLRAALASTFHDNARAREVERAAGYSVD
jgi:hypothetical protein